VANALERDPWPGLVRRAVRYLVTNGPSTGLDRWEDAGGLSPSTLGASIAALSAGAAMASEAGEKDAAAHLLAVADYWNDRLEAWCYLRPFRHFVRLNFDPDSQPSRDAAVGVEFMEVVRRGLRRPDHPTIEHSVNTADALLRADFPVGPAWRRYVGDRYGETADGHPWRVDTGVGRPWPLLTAERGQLAHALGEPVAPYLRALEAFAGPELLLPEQVWDDEDLPERGLYNGGPTGSARPLGWAHAEYLKLLSAVALANRPEVVDPARRRYAETSPDQPPLIWHQRHPFKTFPAGRQVLIQLEQPGLVRWSGDGWATHRDAELRPAGLELYVAELPTGIMRPGAAIEWTPRHPSGWEGGNRALTCAQPEA
jgi:glucoamylase